MKKFYITTGLFGLIFMGLGIVPEPLNARINGSNITANYSGMMITTCNTSGCHTGALNSGPGGVVFASDIPNTGYIGGTEYTINVTVNAGGANGQIFGFSCSAAKEGTTTATGGFAAADNTTLAKNNGTYMVHNNAAAGTGPSDSHTFTFKWTAPAPGTGTVKFFVAGNSGNGSGTPDGDQIYNNSRDITEAPGAGFTEAVAEAFKLFPNPASEYSTVTVPDQWVDGSLRVIDITGKTLFQSRLNQTQLSVDLSLFKAGVYVVQIQKDGKSHSARLLKN